MGRISELTWTLRFSAKLVKFTYFRRYEIQYAPYGQRQVGAHILKGKRFCRKNKGLRPM